MGKRNIHFRLFGRKGKLAAALLLLWGSVAAAPKVVYNSFEQQTVTGETELVVALDGPATADGRKLSVFVGRLDASVLVRFISPAAFQMDFKGNPLPEGSTEMVLAVMESDGAWQEFARIPFVVAKASAVAASDGLGAQYEPSRFSVQPKLDVGIKTQPAFSRSNDAPAPISGRENFSDLTLQGSLRLTGAGEDWNVNGYGAIAGSSYRPEALLYGTKGRDAEKVDLATYRVDGQWAGNQFAIGHINFGRDPLVLNNLANRGVSVARKLNDYVDVAIAGQNGSNIVGTENLLGLNDVNHRFNSTVIGLETNPARPGALRFEVTYSDASVLPSYGFAGGIQREAATSRSIGLRLRAQDESGHLRGDIGMANSRYQNPANAQYGTASTAPTTNRAWSGGISWSAVNGYELAPNWPLYVNMDFRREYSDPYYKALGSFYGADYLLDTFGISLMAGRASLMINGNRREDNVDNVVTSYKNFNRGLGWNLNIPLQSFSDPGSNYYNWIPSLTNSRQVFNAQAVNLGGLPANTALPDMNTQTDSIGLAWNAARGSFAISLQRTTQDNQQSGQENNDIRTMTKDVRGSLRPLDNLNLVAGVGFSNTFSELTSLTQDSVRYNLGFDWAFKENWNLNGNYSYNTNKDSANIQDLMSYMNQLQLTHRFNLPGMTGKPLPAQFYLRYSSQYTQSKASNQFGSIWILYPETRAKTDVIQAGLTISLF